MPQEQTAEPQENILPRIEVYDTREIEADGQKTQFNFLVIDKPEKWAPASESITTFKFQQAGSSRAVNIPLRGISWMEWEEIEMKFPLPEPEEDTNPNQITNKDKDKEFNRLTDLATNKRRASLFELSTGKSLPGETIDEKVASLKKMVAGSAASLFAFIMDESSNLREFDGTLLRMYKDGIKNNSKITEVEFTGFSDFFATASIGSFFQMQRPSDEFIVEFPLKNISDEEKQKIEESVTDPVPQSRPGKNPITGKPDPNFPIFATQEPRYREAMRAAARQRLVMKLEAVLPFKIPGANFEERYKWVGARLLGDVFKLSEFITKEVMNYGGRISFF